MRPVGTHGELQLQSQFVGILSFCIVGKSVLGAKLRKLAGPVSQHQRPPFVHQARVAAALGVVVARADEPAACKLIVAGSVHAESVLGGRKLLAITPYELCTTYGRGVSGAAERLPAKRCIGSIQVGGEVLLKLRREQQAGVVV